MVRGASNRRRHSYRVNRTGNVPALKERAFSNSRVCSTCIFYTCMCMCAMRTYTYFTLPKMIDIMKSSSFNYIILFDFNANAHLFHIINHDYSFGQDLFVLHLFLSDVSRPRDRQQASSRKGPTTQPTWTFCIIFASR